MVYDTGGGGKNSMAVLVVCLVLILLVVLDVRKKMDLGHPICVLLTALGYFCSVVWTVALALLALMETLEGGSLLVWGKVALSTLPGTLFGLYVLLRSNLTPMHRRNVSPARRAVRLLDDGLIVGLPLQMVVVGGYVGLYVLLRSNLTPMHRRNVSPARRAVRLLDDGLIVGLPLQMVVVGGYVLAAVGLQSMFQGPAWMLPFYPLVLVVLWPMMHLVFHVAIAAIVIDPLILLCAMLIGLLWVVQALYLAHGMLRGCLLAKKSGGALVVHILLSFMPVVNLVLAIRLRCILKQAEVSAKEVPA